jgi:Sulfatase
VLLLADSLRTDAIDPEKMPAFLEAMKRYPNTQVTLVPPVARTTPAVTTLLTGKLPSENGVTHMFTERKTFDQRASSIAKRMQRSGFCTIALGDYPIEFLQKVDFGFEFNDVPKVAFRELVLQVVLARDPFATGMLSLRSVRDAGPKELRSLLLGLPSFADAEGLLERLTKITKQCGGRRIFAFLFADQPHFPYVQTFPYYLDAPKLKGRYRYMKDGVSAPENETEREQVRTLYWTSLRASDTAFTRALDAWHKNGSLARATVAVSGDHGESLYGEGQLMGHGDQLMDLKGIAVPLVVFGKSHAAFAFDNPMVSTVFVAGRIERAAGLSETKRPTLAEDLVPVATDLWFADTPNVPKDRLHYPALTELLNVSAPDADVEIRSEFSEIAELAKHRMVLRGGHRYELHPTEDGTSFFLDGKETNLAEAPAWLWKYLETYERHAFPFLQP